MTGIILEGCGTFAGLGFYHLIQRKGKEFCDYLKEITAPGWGAVALTGTACILDVVYVSLMSNDDWRETHPTAPYCLYGIATFSNWAATYLNLWNHARVHAPNVGFHHALPHHK